MNIIGRDRVTNVVKADTQNGLNMTLHEWEAYWYAGESGSKRDRLLNVISLEFSHTDLDSQVVAPAVVCCIHHTHFCFSHAYFQLIRGA